MNRNILHLLLFIAASLTLVACQETLEERCAREARTYTEKKCPTLITEGVMLDSLTFQQSTHTLSYCYTASVRYVYYSKKKSGTKLFDTTFRPKDYK